MGPVVGGANRWREGEGEEGEEEGLGEEEKMAEDKFHQVQF